VKRPLAAAVAAVGALVWAAPLAAHAGEEHGDGAGWTLDPWITLPLALAALLYLVGLARLRARAERGRPRLDSGAWIYAAGWLTLAGALVSPLHQAGERSFTMHMIEHEPLRLVAALLLVPPRPGPVLLWGLPRGLRQVVGQLIQVPVWSHLTQPITATAIQALAIWVWHMPGLFDLALRHEGWHAVQHISFVASALLFWWSMLNRASEALAAHCLFATSMIGGALGALMALSTSPWYAAYARMGVTPEGLGPAEDQQLAGLIMWIPGGLFHLAVALVFLARWLGRKDLNDARLVD
jgi:cytochrome c oxidase assembly factor CtaG